MPFFQNEQGENLFYIDENPAGSPAMVLIHGLGVHSGSWVLQIPEFRNSGYRIIAPDVRGFGQSSKTPFSSLQQASEDIAGLIECLNLENVILSGISMGGMIALQLVLDHPEMVDRLILANSMAQLRLENPLMWPYYAWRFLLIHTKGLEAQAEVVADRLFPQPKDSIYREAVIESIKQADLASYQSAMKAIARFNVQNRLGEIKQPTLVITGENDTTIPQKNQADMARRIKNAVHVVIKDAGHAVTIDQPEQYNCTVLEFLGVRRIEKISEKKVSN